MHRGAYFDVLAAVSVDASYAALPDERSMTTDSTEPVGESVTRAEVVNGAGL